MPAFNLGLTGCPLEHSLSPKIHSAALQACGLAGGYSLFPIQPHDLRGLKDLIARLRAEEIHGLNVTIPHKQNVMPLVDELAPRAKAIGAVNTIYLREEIVIGDNTDAAGFLSDLKRLIGEARIEIGNSALVLGAGGSARAAVYALANDGWDVAIAARREEQAQDLVNSFKNYKLQVVSYSNLRTEEYDLMVNTTPVGMFPNIGESPLPEHILLSPNTVVYDLIYNPRETKLAREARAQGCLAATGLGMLIEQAALAFELWTGCAPPRAAIWKALENWQSPPNS